MKKPYLCRILYKPCKNVTFWSISNKKTLNVNWPTGHKIGRWVKVSGTRIGDTGWRVCLRYSLQLRTNVTGSGYRTTRTSVTTLYRKTVNGDFSRLTESRYGLSLLVKKLGNGTSTLVPHPLCLLYFLLLRVGVPGLTPTLLSWVCTPPRFISHGVWLRTRWPAHTITR